MEPKSQWGKRRLKILQAQHEKDMAETRRLLAECEDMINKGTVARS